MRGLQGPQEVSPRPKWGLVRNAAVVAASSFTTGPSVSGETCKEMNALEAEMKRRRTDAEKKNLGSVQDLVASLEREVETIEAVTQGEEGECPSQMNTVGVSLPGKVEQLLKSYGGSGVTAPNFEGMLGNVVATLYHHLNKTDAESQSTDAVPTKKVNWVGFYIVRNLQSNVNGSFEPDLDFDYDVVKKSDKYCLLLTSFQGLAAKQSLPQPKGVCARSQRLPYNPEDPLSDYVYVSDTHNDPDHVACDQASKSELCVNVRHHKTKEVLAVLDIDCPILDGLSSQEIRDIVKIAKSLEDVWLTVIPRDVKPNIADVPFPLGPVSQSPVSQGPMLENQLPIVSDHIPIPDQTVYFTIPPAAYADVVETLPVF